MGTHAKRLRKARKIRSQMSTQMRQLENAHIHIEDVLQRPSNALGRARVFDVLRRVPKLGRVGAEKVLMKSNTWPNRRLGEIPLEQRKLIIEHLPPRCRR